MRAITIRLQFLLLLMLSFCVLPLHAQWTSDRLGHGLEMLTVPQPDDYDGKVVSTIIHLQAADTFTRGILYIHGYNDYFFQTELAEETVAHGYQFYAVDLRKYGRSLLKGQRRSQVRDLGEYFADIDSALCQMRRDGCRRVVLMGHSTGGLIASLFMAEHPSPLVKVLVLNSPFLAWNFTGFMRHVAIPAAGAVGRFLPDISFSSGGDGRYAKSLLKEYWGEWEFDTSLKLINSAKVTTAWVRAISRAQEYLAEHPRSIHVPILLMHSNRAITSGDSDADYLRGDAVLNPHDISQAGRRLSSRQLTDLTVVGGLHDLILSPLPVRSQVYRYLFSYLDRQPSLQP